VTQTSMHHGHISRNRWSLVLAVSLVVFMATLDGTIVTVALPSIAEEFAVGTGASGWVLLGYMIPLIALALPGGRWLDTVGRRNAFAFTALGFGIASLLVGLAPTFTLLVGGRILQGLFGALLFAVGPVVASGAVTEDARGRAMGLVSTVGPLGAVVGPALGGVFVQHWDWRWIFVVNLPVSVIIAVLGLALMPRDGALRPPDRSRLVEVVLLGGACTALLLAFTQGAEDHLAWLALALAAPPLVAVWLRTPGSAAAMELLRLPGIAGVHLALTAFATVSLTVLFVLPFHLQREWGLQADHSGMVLLALPLAMALFGPVGGRLADRFGARGTALAGMAAVALALALLAPMSQEWTAADVVWRLALMGVGSGLVAGPLVARALGLAPDRLRGTVAASTSTVRQLGFALGPVLATVAWALSDHGPEGPRTAMVGALVVALAGLAALRPWATSRGSLVRPAP
jgi:MFS family permease